MGFGDNYRYRERKTCKGDWRAVRKIGGKLREYGDIKTKE